MTITLVDERFVPADNPRSNHLLVDANLLQNKAKAARFVPLYQPAPSVEEAARLATAKSAEIGIPFDIVILGMGGDGHTASFFPGGSNLAVAIDASTPRGVITMEAEGAGEPRLTFTFSSLKDAALLVLHIEGEGKKDVLAKAEGSGEEAEMPIRAILRRATSRSRSTGLPDQPSSGLRFRLEPPKQIETTNKAGIFHVRPRTHFCDHRSYRRTLETNPRPLPGTPARGRLAGRAALGAWLRQPRPWLRGLFPADKDALAGDRIPNLGIITAYNDMLSAHQPFETYPAIIREAAAQAGGVAQVAGGVPAMCDGVTQGQPGMELSLFSRDLIAMSAGIGLSHNMFDAALFLGVCDKIVPGLVIAALSFGHLPSIFVPAGPMTTGLPNDEKSRVRQLFAEGKVGRAELLEAESKSYHGPGTCTFYGTANSNQMLMEIMGFHMPGSSFINPGTPLREALTREAAKRALAITALGNEFTPAGEMIDERSIVNGVVGLHATGGSTNHTLHLVAMARAAGIQLTWQDIAELSEIVPLLARVYPNGLADVNHFQAAGGMGFLIKELLKHGLVHDDVRTVFGQGLQAYTVDARLDENGAVLREPSPEKASIPRSSPASKRRSRPMAG